MLVTAVLIVQCFFYLFHASLPQPDEVYLNLVMAYIPETIHRTLRTYTKANKLLPIMYTKVYMYQIARSLSYIHSLGVCVSGMHTRTQPHILHVRVDHDLTCAVGVVLFVLAAS
jgi:serine/threonine protein kinase